MRVFTDLAGLPSFRNAVVTIGSFDGVHLGHRRILEKMQELARATGGESVLITFDPHPRAVLQPGDAGFKLITTTSEKIALLQAAGVDNVVVVPFSHEFARQSAEAYVTDFLVQYFRPQHVVIGYDHRFGNNREGDLSFLKKQAAAAGFEVVEIPAWEVDALAVSSSKIRAALDAADPQRANRLLGHPYTLTGRVVRGDGIGRRLGFPTANLALDDPKKLILPMGIYAAQVRVGARRYDAMLYIGDRPTLEGAHGQSVEVNLIDFDGDLYDRELTAEVLDFIRPDKKLENLEALQKQIEEDKIEVMKRLADPRLKPWAEKPADPGLKPGAEKKESIISPRLQPWEARVAIVILNYNTRQHLESFLPSVVAHSAGARIVVADNGSPDDSVDFLQKNFPGVEVLDLQRNHGFAQGYNEALRRVDADIYVVLNSDVEVTAGWMTPVLDAMRRDPGIAIAQPKIKAWRDKTRFEYAGAAGGWIDALGYPFCRGRIFSHSETDMGQYDTPRECFWAAGAAFFIRAKHYHAFGGFDGDYFAHNEEIDLCWRLKQAGYGVWCFPQSVVYHLGGGTLEYENPRKVFLNFRNSLFTLLKNETAGKLCWLLPARLLLDGLAAARFALKGQFSAIRAVLQAHFSFYGQWKKTLRKRREVRRIIEQQRIMPTMNRAGIFSGSIVWAYYARGIQMFSKLFSTTMVTTEAQRHGEN